MLSSLVNRLSRVIPRKWKDHIPMCFPGIIPGYQTKLCSLYEIMLENLRHLMPNLTFGQWENYPWLEVRGINYRFHGFWSDRSSLREWFMLKKASADNLPKKEYYLVVCDFVTRYQYPHMLPTEVPSGISSTNSGGFHRQHMDDLVNYRSANFNELHRIFKLKPDDVIIDGGAFLGFGELRLAPQIPQGHIYAVEARSECFTLLERNVTYNNLRNVSALHQALWREDTMLELKCGSIQANSLISSVCKGKTIQKVQAMSIDSLVEKLGLHKLDMVSLTLNGAEVEALQGAARTLRQFKPRIRLAGWYHRNNIPIWKIAKEILAQANYRVYVTDRGNVLAFPEK